MNAIEEYHKTLKFGDRVKDAYDLKAEATRPSCSLAMLLT
jgi:hypothetical protein